MTLDQLRDAQRQALTHMNLCRKVRDVVLCDIDSANEHKELVSEDTLDLCDYLSQAAKESQDSYALACATVDKHLGQLAGITKED